jgi:C-terminal processing protease CtpA/Prc
MINNIFFDDILHAFESDGNLHLVLGSVNGEVDESGNNLRGNVTTLVIPNSRANIVSENISKAISLLLDPVSSENKEFTAQENSTNEKKEFLGQGITLKC